MILSRKKLKCDDMFTSAKHGTAQVWCGCRIHLPPNQKSSKFLINYLIYGKMTFFFSQSFHYAGFHDQKGQFHERLAPLYEPTAIDIVRNQGAGTELQNRKLPDLPDSKFNPVHSTARRNPLSVRSAPNLHRLENIILVNESPIPKTDDSSGESGFNEKSPLIRKSQRYKF